jgi:hypothetical protein
MAEIGCQIRRHCLTEARVRTLSIRVPCG